MFLDKQYIINGERITREDYYKTISDSLSIRIPRGQKEILQSHAIKQGESLNGFVNRAINEAMKRDNNK